MAADDAGLARKVLEQRYRDGGMLHTLARAIVEWAEAKALFTAPDCGVSAEVRLARMNAAESALLRLAGPGGGNG